MWGWGRVPAFDRDVLRCHHPPGTGSGALETSAALGHLEARPLLTGGSCPSPWEPYPAPTACVVQKQLGLVGSQPAVTGLSLSGVPCCKVTEMSLLGGKSCCPWIFGARESAPGGRQAGPAGSQPQVGRQTPTCALMSSSLPFFFS